MGRLEQFLMTGGTPAAKETEVYISRRFTTDTGEPLPFVIKTITEGEHKELRKSCQTVSHNKAHQRQVDIDQALYGSRMIAACTVDPNFKSAALQEKHGVCGAEALTELLLLPGEHNELLLSILRLNGFDEDIDGLVKQAKN